LKFIKRNYLYSEEVSLVLRDLYTKHHFRPKFKFFRSVYFILKKLFRYIKNLFKNYVINTKFFRGKEKRPDDEKKPTKKKPTKKKPTKKRQLSEFELKLLRLRGTCTLGKIKDITKKKKQVTEIKSRYDKCEVFRINNLYFNKNKFSKLYLPIIKKPKKDFKYFCTKYKIYWVGLIV
jgi:hypothetical protein